MGNVLLEWRTRCKAPETSPADAFRNRQRLSYRCSTSAGTSGCCFGCQRLWPLWRYFTTIAWIQARGTLGRRMWAGPQRRKLLAARFPNTSPPAWRTASFFDRALLEAGNGLACTICICMMLSRVMCDIRASRNSTAHAKPEDSKAAGSPIRGNFGFGALGETRGVGCTRPTAVERTQGTHLVDMRYLMSTAGAWSEPITRRGHRWFCGDRNEEHSYTV